MRNKRGPQWRWLPLASIYTASFLLISATLTLLSYFRSDSLTVMDATVRTDEGLISLLIPLTRLEPNQQASTEWKTYYRGKAAWEHPDGNRARLRYWMSLRNQIGFDGAIVGGFGYWKGEWQSSSRTGPFIVTFVPIWFVVATSCLLVGAFIHRYIRLSMRTLLICTVVAAGMFALLSLRGAE